MNYAAMDIHNIHLSTFIVDVRENGKHKWIVRHWLPEGSLSEHPDFKYFAEQGFIRVMPGETADIDTMIAEVRLLQTQYGFVEVAGDSINLDSIFRLILENDGLDIVRYQLTFEMLNEPTRAFLEMRQELLVDNPVLAWMFENVKLIEDMRRNKKPTKIESRKPIGGLVAGIMALGRALREDHIEPRTEYFYHAE